MSEFDDFMAGGFEGTLDVLGTTPFVVVGRPGQFLGSYDQLQDGEEVEVGGRVVVITGQLICQLAQFQGDIPKTGRTIEMLGRKMKIGTPQVDEISVNFPLVSNDQ